ncbi:MAG: hypothetical protein U1E45_14850 [Geminicoccaceae bacterium]
MSKSIWARLGDFLMGDLPAEDRPKLSAAASAICSERRLRERVDELLRANNELTNKNRELDAEARIGRAFKEALKAARAEEPSAVIRGVSFGPGDTIPRPRAIAE